MMYRTRVYFTVIVVTLHLCSFIVSSKLTTGLAGFERSIRQIRIAPSQPPEMIVLKFIKRYKSEQRTVSSYVLQFVIARAVASK
jgi:hypothetical protein